jgi:hypothetical protein
MIAAKTACLGLVMMILKRARTTRAGGGTRREPFDTIIIRASLMRGVSGMRKDEISESVVADDLAVAAVSQMLIDIVVDRLSHESDRAVAKEEVGTMVMLAACVFRDR